MGILSQTIKRLCFYLSIYKCGNLFSYFKRSVPLAVFGRKGGMSIKLVSGFVFKNNFSMLLLARGRLGCVQCFWKDDTTVAVLSSKYCSVSTSHKVANLGRVFKLCVLSIWLSFNSRETEEAGSGGTGEGWTKNNFYKSVLVLALQV